MNNHGHVRPNQDGSRARCGGPGICMECSLEANAYKLSAMGGCNSCNDLESKLSAAEKERDSLKKSKFAVEVEELREAWREHQKEQHEEWVLDKNQIASLKDKLAVAVGALEDLRTGIYHTSRVTGICEKALKAINGGEV